MLALLICKKFPRTNCGERILEFSWYTPHCGVCSKYCSNIETEKRRNSIGCTQKAKTKEWAVAYSRIIAMIYTTSIDGLSIIALFRNREHFRRRVQRAYIVCWSFSAFVRDIFVVTNSTWHARRNACRIPSRVFVFAVWYRLKPEHVDKFLLIPPRILDFIQIHSDMFHAYRRT